MATNDESRGLMPLMERCLRAEGVAVERVREGDDFIGLRFLVGGEEVAAYKRWVGPRMYTAMTHRRRALVRAFMELYYGL